MRVGTVERPNSDEVLTVRGPPTATAAPNCGWFGSIASAARKKYFDFTPAHSNGPSRILRSPGLSDSQPGLCGLAALVTSASWWKTASESASTRGSPHPLPDM